MESLLVMHKGVTMEKTYTMDQREAQQLQQMEQDRMQALAAVGALSLDMEAARKNLDAVAERQRAFIRLACDKRGLEKYDGARIQNGTLFVNVPDMPIAMDALPVRVDRPNGLIEAK